jgi:predicted enzyme related to lactoylglutathione lyase
MATLEGIAPIFPTADFDAMKAHYEALGFAVYVHGGGYGTVECDGIKIHFRHVPGLGSGGVPSADSPEPGTQPAAAYIAVDDVDALHTQWRAAGVGETSDVFDPGFGVREAAHVDADGNMIRFGSRAGAS